MPEPQKPASKGARRFDPGRPYGVVFGHLSGKYEQDGIVYGANGLPVDKEVLSEEEKLLAEENRAAEAARAKELSTKGKA